VGALQEITAHSCLASLWPPALLPQGAGGNTPCCSSTTSPLGAWVVLAYIKRGDRSLRAGRRHPPTHQIETGGSLPEVAGEAPTWVEHCRCPACDREEGVVGQPHVVVARGRQKLGDVRVARVCSRGNSSTNTINTMPSLRLVLMCCKLHAYPALDGWGCSWQNPTEKPPSNPGSLLSRPAGDLLPPLHPCNKPLEFACQNSKEASQPASQPGRRAGSGAASSRGQAGFRKMPPAPRSRTASLQPASLPALWEEPVLEKQRTHLW
jgi:hypothetical protein